MKKGPQAPLLRDFVLSPAKTKHERLIGKPFIYKYRGIWRVSGGYVDLDHRRPEELERVRLANIHAAKLNEERFNTIGRMYDPMPPTEQA